MSRASVLIVPPAVYQYRVAFYEALSARLAAEGVDMSVVAGSGPPSIEHRNDHAEATWTVPARVSWYRVGDREVAVRDLRGTIREHGPTHVIVENAIRNVETYPLMLLAARNRLRLAMWGHGRTYNRRQTPPEAWLKNTITNRADWFFAYTEDGAEYVRRRGYPDDRISVVNNTVDTEFLRAEIGAITSRQVDEFRAEHSLTAGVTALFIGGVDRAKGIEFLLTSARRASARLPGFTLVVAGHGDLAPSVEAAQRAGEAVRFLGRVNGHEKALALAACDVLAIPRGVGLVAVDALVSGRPILTTRDALHGPEYGYLTPGNDSLVSRADPVDYSDMLVGIRRDPERLAAMGQQAVTTSHGYSMESMVERFADGILAWQRLSPSDRAGRI